MQNHLMESQFNRNMSPSKLNISNLKPINEQNQSAHHEGDDISLIDTTKDRKELNVEFDQVTKLQKPILTNLFKLYVLPII